ncbi:MAG TPA: acylneuraminate cytidylyltransferase family protein [Verrucomicrobiae bacterium]|nr:acylneuraminate cytidylyltransferase family protein [Verrucomicrobiae bacterium]
MYKGHKVLALIPARGGSKGLPGKNIRKFADKPLVAWSIEQALASKAVDKVMVSTDNEEIAAVARRHGAEVPFLRPAEFARDNSPVSEAIIHAVRTLREMGERYDIVLLVECTSPVRYPGDLDDAVARLVDNPQADSVVGAVQLTHEHPMWTFRLSRGYLTSFIAGGHKPKNCRRQALETTYLPYAHYLTWWKNYESRKTFYQPRTLPHFLKREQMVEIDDEVDFFIAESIMKKYIIGSSVKK